MKDVECHDLMVRRFRNIQVATTQLVELYARFVQARSVLLYSVTHDCSSSPASATFRVSIRNEHTVSPVPVSFQRRPTHGAVGASHTSTQKVVSSQSAVIRRPARWQK